MLQGIHEILYFVPDRRAAAEWFSRFLDCPITTLDDSGRFFIRAGELEIWFNQADAKTPAGLGGHVAFWRVADLDEALLRAQKLGAVLYWGPLDRLDGTFMAQVLAPFGSVIGLLGPSRQKTYLQGRAPLNIQATIQHRGWLRRRITLTGDVQASISFSARRAGIGLTTPPDPTTASERGLTPPDEGVELEVNGRAVPFGNTGTGDLKQLTFLVGEGAAALPARLDVRLDGWMGSGFVRLLSLQLRVAGELLCEENDGRTAPERDPLPIPAASSSPEGVLPRPAASPPAADDLRHR